MSRLPARLVTVAGALLNRIRFRAEPDPSVRRILIAHNLLLGDTLLLAPLMAKLAACYPAAERIILARPAVAPLFSGQPWGWRAEPFDVRDAGLPARLHCGAGFDRAFVLGDNRYSWLARAAGARWIIGFDKDRPAWKNWMLDEAHPHQPMAWADMAATLTPGDPPAGYQRGDWPAPRISQGQEVAPLPRPYAVLHVGASSSLKAWPAERWWTLARDIAKQGLDIVWSAGRGEEALVDAADPEGAWLRHCGDLALPQLWHLIAGARQLVCPDTGIAHLGRVVGTPTVALFGPGSVAIHGAGEFWANSPFIAVSDLFFHCRDQNILFRRELPWVRRCQRGVLECSRPACMEAISVAGVMAAVEQLQGWG